ncbi:porin [Flavobacteriaceae bacterium]|uniref:porin n=1 Tax=Candidatus Arcticimaribacter forsetii TaxID=2820661 RepID=UPI0020772911|nr:porin [Candidatus Arcticimaribacter forsetii]MDB2329535.1 OprO/OprP family phosphate-selective porin [Flavobacteriaceae bacterium]MDB2345339.1 OprO/OprP family phosphate-selective porin [Flavobacteriaceae bacterium]MDB2456561.1 OprO/OprP family phosphate-selective porin [Flavobacteriaceae bacterium]MDB4620905.1 OprO/OprP family phosphate-selective porin [Flavobacteriaceae bacterium]MDB4674353.1 OprO/OprP family phosphate-selective porin [Flavobacteriaceae bacterium]
MKAIKKVTVLLLLTITSTFAQEVTTSKFGKGLLNITGKDSTFYMNFSARMQYLSATSWSEGDFENRESNFLVRRSRLKFSGFAYNPKLTYKLELGLSNRDISGASAFTSNAPRYILDAYIRWNFYKNFTLQAGQGKLPGNIERVISSGNLALVDRSLLNSKFNIDRDLGIQFRHHFKLSENFIVKEIFAISQGEGRNITKGNLGGHQYTSRIEVLPFGKFKSKGDYKGADLDREQTPKLLVGVVYDVNNNAVKSRSNMGSYLETNEGFYQTDINTLFFDTHFKYRGFSLMAEYADRDADDPIAKNEDNSLTGDVVNIGNSTNIQMGYVTPSNLAITGRYTNVNFDSIVSSNNKITQYTIGLSKYVAKHKLKVQTDLTYEDSVSSSNKLVYRLQFDIHF